MSASGASAARGCQMQQNSSGPRQSVLTGGISIPGKLALARALAKVDSSVDRATQAAEKLLNAIGGKGKTMTD